MPVEIAEDSPLKAGETRREDMKPEWKPSIILFADGTSSMDVDCDAR